MLWLNEKVMWVYDNMIVEVDKQGLCLILLFIDYWWWWGGCEQLVVFYYEKVEDFYWIDSKIFKVYLDVICQVIIWINIVIGCVYYDEKVIMVWEIGNELEDINVDFLYQIVVWIKKWVFYQLVVDGIYKKINLFVLIDFNVDIVSNYYYINVDNNYFGQVMQDLCVVGG